MAIVFQCPYCGHKLRAPDQVAGQQARCKCGRAVAVPSVGSPQITRSPAAAARPNLLGGSPPANRGRPASTPSRVQPVKRSLWPWYAGAGGAALCLVAGAVVLFAMLGRGRTPADAGTPGAAPEPPKEVVNSIGMKLVRIPAGTFIMGSPETEPGHKAGELEGEAQHEVTIGKPFYMGAYEVTVAEFEKVTGSSPMKVSVSTGNAPDISRWAIGVSPKDAAEFCRKLTALAEEKRAGRTYRLPTEAEWEYACRAGSKAAYCFGDDPAQLDQYAWYDANVKMHMTQPVGRLKPNAWGLYDMHGNVEEFCCAAYKPGKDPQDPGTGEAEVQRGGSFMSKPRDCRCASRSLVLGPDMGGLNTGFRVVCTGAGAGAGTPAPVAASVK